MRSSGRISVHGCTRRSLLAFKVDEFTRRNGFELKFKRVLWTVSLGVLVHACVLVLLGSHLVHHRGSLRNVNYLLFSLVLVAIGFAIVLDETVGLATHTEPCNLRRTIGLLSCLRQCLGSRRC